METTSNAAKKERLQKQEEYKKWLEHLKFLGVKVVKPSERR
ncbi:hypothetical protein [Calderihabitans maritimus]|uniref:Uncharacterized protein n=1 Tax=Calderihabitans maritimus TaxID=1246530 RepID=A0A1Z5HU15_9FIRM|nr:hypothetical protein [Calderihabitans maritimus]GAW93012.1 hypothetical protein KKC1_21560 [Calderihabitans maritimus]